MIAPDHAAHVLEHIAKLEDQRAKTKASIAAGRIDPKHGRMILAGIDYYINEAAGTDPAAKIGA